jgi:hypothetical protein
MPYRLSNRQISFFPHPSLRQAWYLFELQHQSHSDNGFFDIAAVCRVVQMYPARGIRPANDAVDGARSVASKCYILVAANPERFKEGEAR